MNEGYVKFSAKLREAGLPEYSGWQHHNQVRASVKEGKK